jgi:O-antigen ligase
MHFKKINKFFFLQLAIISIVPFLIWGPFFPDLIVSLSSIIFLIFVVKNKEYRFIYNKPLIIFFIFCSYCVVLSIFSENLMLSLKSSLFYIRFGLFSCVVWYLIEKDELILKYFFYVICICFILLILDGSFQYTFGKNIFGLPILGQRVSSFFGDELIMGSYLSRLFPLLLALLIVIKKRTYVNYFIFPIIFLSGILIFISSERTALLFYVLTIFLIMIFVKDHRKPLIISFICTLIVASIIIINNPWAKNRMVDKIFNVFIQKEVTHKYIFSPAHDTIYRTAFKMFLDKPITGHGPKMYRELNLNPKYFININSGHSHPHNFYIQLLAETGIIGLSFLLLFLFYVLYSLARQFVSIIFNKKKPFTDYQVCLLIAMLLTLWPLSPNGNFFNNWLSIIYSLPMGFYLHSIFGSNKALKNNIII